MKKGFRLGFSVLSIVVLCCLLWSLGITGSGSIVSSGSLSHYGDSTLKAEGGVDGSGASDRNSPDWGKTPQSENPFYLHYSEVISERDGMITPGDRLRVRFTFFCIPGLEEVRIRFYSTSSQVAGVSRKEISLRPGDRKRVTVENTLRIKANGEVASELYEKENSVLPVIEKPLMLIYELRTEDALEYGTSLCRPLLEGEPLKVVYPHFAEKSDEFLIDPPLGKDRFYLRGDTDFANIEDPKVRKMAIFAASYEKGHFPDHPEDVVRSIYEFTADTLEPTSWAEEELFTSRHVAGWWMEGKIGPDTPYPEAHGKTLSSETRPAGFICIEHAYLFTSLVRTLGIPAREVNTSFLTHIVEGGKEYRKGYYGQEAAAQAYYSGEWHFYDPFLGYTSFEEYRDEFWDYLSWYAYDARSEEKGGVDRGAKNEYRHDFWFSSDGSGEPYEKDHWKYLRSGFKAGVVVSLIEGSSTHRIVCVSEEGEKTGFTEAGEEVLRISNSLYYPKRSVPPLGPYPSRYPDIVFLPLNEGATYKVKVHTGKSDGLLKKEENKKKERSFDLVFLLQAEGKEKPTVYSTAGTLDSGTRVYELQIRTRDKLVIQKAGP